ncbi:MAG: M20 family metallopeptidase [Halobacteriaceae archaeon]
MTTTDLIELSAELVRIPSHEDPTEAGDYIENWLEDNTSSSIKRDEVGNVFAKIGSGSQQLAFIGHHDVVPPSGSQTRNDAYTIEQKNGRLYGRGTADMKGALAAFLLAFQTLDENHQQQLSQSNLEVIFGSFVGEETGGEGARHAIKNGFSPTYAVVGEGTTNYSGNNVTDIAVAHKGRRALTITANGKSAHASVPEQGDNALIHGANVIKSLESVEPPTVTVAGEQLHGSIVPTKIRGGETWNVIPDACDITVDERTVPGERVDLEAKLSTLPVDITIDQDLPPMQCDDPKFANIVQQAATKAQSTSPKLVVKPHATDAGWLADNGVTCVICGPAESGEAHTDTESVSIDVLERCQRIYENIVKQMIADETCI